MLWVVIRITSTHNVCFYGEISKNIPKLSSLSVPLLQRQSLIWISLHCLLRPMCPDSQDLYGNEVVPVTDQLKALSIECCINSDHSDRSYLRKCVTDQLKALSIECSITSNHITRISS